MNQLTNIDFSVDFKPSEIKINNFESLKNGLEEHLKRYQGLVVTEDSLKGSKTTRAELNKLKKSIDDRRKEIKKEYTKPLNEFEANVKTLVQSVNEVVSNIDVGIKELEQRQREEKRLEVQALIDEIATNYNVNASEIPFNDSWLNKSMSKKALLDAIAGEAKHLQMISESKKALIAHCESVGVPYEPYIPNLEVFGFFETMKMVDSDVEAREERKKAQEEIAKAKIEAEKEKLTEVNDVTYDVETGEVVNVLQEITFKLKGTKEQIDDIARYVMNSGVQIVSASERKETIERS